MSQTSTSSTRLRALLSAIAAIALSGCATYYSDDGGFDTAATAAREHLGQEAQWLRTEEEQARASEQVSKHLEKTLSVEDAMQIALLNNPGLQAAYGELGVTEAERIQAGRLPNPGFSFGRTSGEGAVEIERALSFSVGAILTMPLRVMMENRRFEAAKLAAASDTLDVAFATREAYFNAVAAQEMRKYMRQVLDAAEASRDLMNRMSRVGTSSKLQLARERLFHAEATIALARAVQDEVAAREALVRELGLFGKQLDFTLPDRLPELPPSPRSFENIEETALTQRLDLQMAQIELDSLKTSLNITSASHFIRLLEEAGPAQVRERGEPVRNGYELVVEIPIFDFGDARVAGAKAVYMQGVQRLRAVAINARSELREVYHGYRTAYDIAKHYHDEIVPLRARISEEQLLRYNGMLTGVFDLIDDAREQVVSVSEAVQAKRDFWLLETALKRVSLGAGSPSMGSAEQMSAPQSGGAQEH